MSIQKTSTTGINTLTDNQINLPVQKEKGNQPQVNLPTQNKNVGNNLPPEDTYNSKLGIARPNKLADFNLPAEKKGKLVAQVQSEVGYPTTGANKMIPIIAPRDVKNAEAIAKIYGIPAINNVGTPTFFVPNTEAGGKKASGILQDMLDKGFSFSDQTFRGASKEFLKGFKDASGEALLSRVINLGLMASGVPRNGSGRVSNQSPVTNRGLVTNNNNTKRNTFPNLPKTTQNKPANTVSNTAVTGKSGIGNFTPNTNMPLDTISRTDYTKKGRLDTPIDNRQGPYPNTTPKVEVTDSGRASLERLFRGQSAERTTASASTTNANAGKTNDTFEIRFPVEATVNGKKEKLTFIFNASAIEHYETKTGGKGVKFINPNTWAVDSAGKPIGIGKTDKDVVGVGNKESGKAYGKVMSYFRDKGFSEVWISERERSPNGNQSLKTGPRPDVVFVLKK
jgi:hypothetical protein